ncbi:MAG: superinfection immunity protein [Idiomarina sp.]
MEILNTYLSAVQEADPFSLVLFGVLFLAVWFLPAVLAVFFNRRHLVKIAVLNVPAGLSVIAWGALCVWAATGKMSAKLAAKARLKPVE